MPFPKEVQENLEKDTLMTWLEIFWTDIIFEAFFPEIKQKKFRWKFFQASEMNTLKKNLGRKSSFFLCYYVKKDFR